MIAAYIYRKILERLNLSKKDLQKLRNELRPENICSGPFLKDGKMCPTTTALSIRLKVSKFHDNDLVGKKFKELGVKRWVLKLLYLTFDIPSMISKNYFARSIHNFRRVVERMISER